MGFETTPPFPSSRRGKSRFVRIAKLVDFYYRRARFILLRYVGIENCVRRAGALGIGEYLCARVRARAGG